MPKTKTNGINWLAAAEEHDYPAAESYLNLIYATGRATKLVSKLKTVKIKSFKAKDIFRASSLSLLGVSNSHVEKNRKKIRIGQGLSPLLLVRNAHGFTIPTERAHRPSRSPGD